jgi:hypothetical protein
VIDSIGALIFLACSRTSTARSTLIFCSIGGQSLIATKLWMIPLMVFSSNAEGKSRLRTLTRSSFPRAILSVRARNQGTNHLRILCRHKCGNRRSEGMANQVKAMLATSPGSCHNSVCEIGYPRCISRVSASDRFSIVWANHRAVTRQLFYHLRPVIRLS